MISAVRKLAIVGSHPRTRGDAPWNDPSYDIWVFNEAAQYSWATRVTGVFQLHKRLRYRRTMNTAHSEHWKWLQQDHGYPIWMQEVDPLVPASVRYPLPEIIGKLGCEERYFTSTMAYAIALGLYLEYDEIHLYGVEVASSTEYQHQRDNLAYWVGFAQASGRKFTRHCADGVFVRPLYGYEGGVYHDPEEFAERIALLRQNEAEAVQTKTHADAALELAYAEPGPELARQLEADLIASIELGRIRGKLFEATRYAQMVQEMFDRDQMAKLDRAYFDISAGQAKVAAEAETYEVHRTAGSMDYVWMAWEQTKSPAAIAQLRQFAQQHLEHGYQSGYQQGREYENTMLMAQYDERLEAGGETAGEDMLIPAEAMAG